MKASDLRTKFKSPENLENLPKYADIVVIGPNINRRILEKFFELFDTIPEHWRRRTKKNWWKIYLKNHVYAEDGDRTVFNICYYPQDIELNANVKLRHFKENFYDAISSYVYLSYFPKGLESFQSIIASESEEIIKLVKSLEEDNVFKYFFKYFLKTKGKSTKMKKAKKTAEYVYKWYTGEIFTHHMINIPSYLEIGDGVIDEKIEMVIDTINLLPRNLLRSFVFQHNGKIKLKAGHIFRKPKYACEGTYNYTRNTVSITVLTTNLQMIILHEFGHVLDEYCSMPSIRDDFLFIFNDERELAKNFCRNEFEYKYISSNSMEFFAETFARYISSKEVLPPRTYHFLKNLISK